MYSFLLYCSFFKQRIGIMLPESSLRLKEVNFKFTLPKETLDSLIYVLLRNSAIVLLFFKVNAIRLFKNQVVLVKHCICNHISAKVHFPLPFPLILHPHIICFPFSSLPTCRMVTTTMRGHLDQHIRGLCHVPQN